MKRPMLLLSAIAAFAAATAAAKECVGVKFADQQIVDGRKLALNGLGVRQATLLKLNLYVAGLYVEKTTSDPNAIIAASAPVEVILHFLRNVSADDIRKGWDEGFARNSGAQLPALRDRIGTFNAWMTNMKSGQRITFLRKPGAGVLVSVNGRGKGTILGDDFGKAFLSIWLGRVPPNPDLKSGMLGGGCG